MKAINRYIIVKKIKTEPKKVAGLIMTDDTDVDNRYLKAKIISCGNLVEGLKMETRYITTNMLGTMFRGKTLFIELFVMETSF